jgi:hypothetical protein
MSLRGHARSANACCQMQVNAESAIMADQPTTQKLSELELQAIVPLLKAAELSSLSVDTLRRRHRDRILKLSPRRAGMRVRDALMLKA